MKAWRLERLGGALRLEDIGVLKARAGGVVVRIDTSSLMSYMKDYADGKLAIYRTPGGAFAPDGSGVGVAHEAGADVWHLAPGQRVVLSSHVVAQENVAEPAQILLGITAAGPTTEHLQSYWRDGMLAEFAQWPASAVTLAQELPGVDSTQLALSTRFVVPYAACCGAASSSWRWRWVEPRSYPLAEPPAAMEAAAAAGSFERVVMQHRQ